MAKRSSLKGRFARLLGVSVLCGLVMAGLVFFFGSHMVDRLGKDVRYREAQTQKRAQVLQEYVEKNDVAATDSEALLAWCSTQPLVLMEVYRNDKLLFSSAYSEEEVLYELDVDAMLYDWRSYQTIDFSDGAADLLIMCDDTYQLRTWVAIGAICAGVLLLLFLFLRGVASVATYLVELSAGVSVMEGGDLSHPVEVRGTDEIAELAESLNSMRLAFLAQREAEALSIQANQSLVAGLSHDLRTPLTKIALFVEILRSGRCEGEDQFNEYLGKIETNIDQIKRLSNDILRYSLTQADGGENVTVAVPFSDATGVFLSEMADFLLEKGFDLGEPPELPDDEVMVCEEHLQRVFDNLASNMDRYAAREQPVLVWVSRCEGRIGIVFENAVDTRATVLEGTGVGLANVRYLMGRMRGSCEVESQDGAFRTTLWFATSQQA